MTDIDGVERHSVTIFTSRRGAWSVCECGWQSEVGSSAFFPRTDWSDHVSSVVRAAMAAETAESIERGRADLAAGRSASFDTADELIAYLNDA